MAAAGGPQEIKLFGKWSYDDVEVAFASQRSSVDRCARNFSFSSPALQVNDISLEDYIAVKSKNAVFVPHTAGRYQKKRFRKAQCPIVERYIQHRQHSQQAAAESSAFVISQKSFASAAVYSAASALCMSACQKS